jgi:hypothetical protein
MPSWYRAQLCNARLSSSANEIMALRMQLKVAQCSSMQLNAAQLSSSQLTSTEKSTKTTASNPPTKLTPHA